MEVYLDNAATTRIDIEVADAMLPFLEEQYGNPSSLHKKGAAARSAIDAAKKKVASALHATVSEIVFTSGGTESNNLAIKGYAHANKNKGNHIIISAIEHPSVMRACKSLETDFRVTRIPVNKEGKVDPKKVERHLTDKTILVSVMHANNETGAIQPIQDIYTLCKERGVTFHTDAAQSFKKIPITVEDADIITISSHKIHGPKGVGALFVKQGIKLRPLIDGGSQEHELRAGTENVPGITGFGSAVGLEAHTEEMDEHRTYLIAKVRDAIPQATLVGGDGALCNIANFLFHMEGDALLLHLDAHGVSVSTGSACSSKSISPSHVLKAMGFSDKEALRSVRFSLSKHTTNEEIDHTVAALQQILS